MFLTLIFSSQNGSFHIDLLRILCYLLALPRLSYLTKHPKSAQILKKIEKIQKKYQTFLEIHFEPIQTIGSLPIT